MSAEKNMSDVATRLFLSVYSELCTFLGGRPRGVSRTFSKHGRKLGVPKKVSNIQHLQKYRLGAGFVVLCVKRCYLLV